MSLKQKVNTKKTIQINKDKDMACEVITFGDENQLVCIQGKLQAKIALPKIYIKKPFTTGKIHICSEKKACREITYDGSFVGLFIEDSGGFLLNISNTNHVTDGKDRPIKYIKI